MGVLPNEFRKISERMGYAGRIPQVPRFGMNVINPSGVLPLGLLSEQGFPDFFFAGLLELWV